MVFVVKRGSIGDQPATKDVHAPQQRAAPRERHDGGVGEQLALPEAHALQQRAVPRERHDGALHFPSIVIGLTV